VLAAGKPVLAGLKAGSTLTVTLRVTLDGSAPPAGRAQCALRLRGRALRLASSAFAGGKATCRWRTPASARGARVSGSIGAVVDGRRVTKPFATRLR
jgi:hypothetical protein